MISPPLMKKEKRDLTAYWRRNLRYLLILTLIWFVAGIVLPILLVDTLNQVKIAGFPLGFWVSMQGAIIVFVLLMFVYTWLMNKLDADFGLDEE